MDTNDPYPDEPTVTANCDRCDDEVDITKRIYSQIRRGTELVCAGCHPSGKIVVVAIGTIS